MIRCWWAVECAVEPTHFSTSLSFPDRVRSQIFSSNRCQNMQKSKPLKSRQSNQGYFSYFSYSRETVSAVICQLQWYEFRRKFKIECYDQFSDKEMISRWPSITLQGTKVPRGEDPRAERCLRGGGGVGHSSISFSIQNKHWKSMSLFDFWMFFFLHNG